KGLSLLPPAGPGLVEPLLSQRVQVEMQKIVPWEFFKGQKFDINRQFGDGLDSNNNGERDDPSEAAVAPYEYAWAGGNANVLPNLPVTFQNVYSQPTNGIDYINGGPPSLTYPGDNFYPRQLYARHLFCLAMLMLPPDFANNTPSSFPPLP